MSSSLDEERSRELRSTCSLRKTSEKAKGSFIPGAVDSSKMFTGYSHRPLFALPAA